MCSSWTLCLSPMLRWKLAAPECEVRMKSKIPGNFGACIRRAFLAVVVCTSLVATARGDVSVGDTPQLKAVAIDGTRIDLAALKGKLVLVDFWISVSDLDKNYERKLID